MPPVLQCWVWPMHSEKTAQCISLVNETVCVSGFHGVLDSIINMTLSMGFLPFPHVCVEFMSPHSPIYWMINWLPCVSGMGH